MSNGSATLRIRPVDVWSDDELDRLQELYVAAVRADQPDARVVGRAETAAVLRTPSTDQFYTSFAAERDGELVGQSLLMGRLTDNTHAATVLIWVAPEHARRGVGSALARHAEDHLTSLGRHTVQTEAWIDRDEPSRQGYRNFVERLGYTFNGRQIERRLSLPASEARLEELAREAAAHHGDYAIQVLDGPIPPDLASAYCDLYNHLYVEMPSTDPDVQATRRTPQTLAEQDASIQASEQSRLTVYAAAPDGSWAAMTVLIVPSVGHGVDTITAPDAAMARQWATLVHPAHRGHRLGLAVKVRQLQEVGQRHPHLRTIGTSNAETNAHMVAINERLGFAIHSVEGEFSKRLIP